MAIRLTDAYPNRVGPANSDYPHGSIVNESAPDAGDGTPLERQWGNDLAGFMQALLETADITPSGSPDTAPDSQHIDALLSVTRGLTTVDVGGSSDVTLATYDRRMAMVKLTGALTADIDVIVSDVARHYVFINETTGDFTVTVKNSGGSGVVVKNDDAKWLYSDGTAVKPLLYSRSETNHHLRGRVSGIVPSNNGSDADHDIDFTEGVVFAVDGSDYVEVPPLTKRFDAAFAKGPDAGGLGGGVSLPTEGTLHVFAIKEDATGDGDLFGDTDEDGGGVPSGWSVVQRVFSITTDASANISAFSSMEMAGGALETRVAPVADFSIDNPGTSALLQTLGVPTGIRVRALTAFSVRDTSAEHGRRFLLVTSPEVEDVAPTSNTHSVSCSGLNDALGQATGTSEITIRTDTSAQVRVRLESSNDDVVISGTTFGWIQERGASG